MRQSSSTLQEVPIAIIGMAGVFPESESLRDYWNKIVKGEYCIIDVPDSHWPIDDYYDENPQSGDKIYCKKGGFMPDLDFDPVEYGVPPNIMEAMDPSQIYSLHVAKNALMDAGIDLKTADKDRIGVILGSSTAKTLCEPLVSRMQHPLIKRVLKSSGLSDEQSQNICDKINASYVEWQETSFPGLLSNVITGRIANRFDLGGTNYTVDAACASSLAAIRIAISELIEHRVDIVLTGGTDTGNSPFSYMCFTKTPALSRRQEVRPFDEKADGTIISEGVGMLVFKRLADAKRDNDRIYAVIRGIGASSDGRAKSIYAPNEEGQKRAL
jgi:acyl transferase domain-containing protein